MGDFVNHNPDGLSSKEVVEIIDSVRNSRGYQELKGGIEAQKNRIKAAEKNTDEAEKTTDEAEKTIDEGEER